MVSELSPLTALRAELERLGYVVVPHGAELCVRLPLLCSVRIDLDAGRFSLRPQFGPFGRTGGLLATSGVAVAAVAGASLAFGAGAGTILVAFVGLAALVHDGCRFVLTEGCLTRLQQLLTTPGALSGSAPPALGDGRQTAPGRLPEVAATRRHEIP